MQGAGKMLFSYGITARSKHGQRVGNALVKLFVRAAAAVKLVKHLAVFNEKHSARVACRLNGVGYHHDRVPGGIDLLKQP